MKQYSLTCDYTLELHSDNAYACQVDLVEAIVAVVESFKGSIGGTLNMKQTNTQDYDDGRYDLYM